MSKIKLLLFGVVLAALLAVPGTAMAKSRDRDHDGLPDKWEKKFHLSTHKKSAKGDPDRDGLNNMGEFRSRTNPRRADTNHNGVNDANDDQDKDGVSNRDEMRDHTNPCDRDTDNDGVGDGEETIGTVAGFVEDSANPGTGVLTITLKDNSTVSGKVDSSTEIECRAPEHAGVHRAARRPRRRGRRPGRPQRSRARRRAPSARPPTSRREPRSTRRSCTAAVTRPCSRR